MQKIEKIIKVFGAMLIFFSALMNPFVGAQLFSPDKVIASSLTTIRIIIFQIFMLLIGGFFYFKKNLIIKPNQKFLAGRKKSIMLLLVTSIICLIVLEGAARVILPSTAFHPTYFDEKKEKYGWYPPENSVIKNEVQDSENLYRNVTVEYFENGFKRWGQIDTNKTKALVIGDSYTEAYYVNNGEEYYAYLEEEFNNTEWFVFGSAGYGSVQEYLILENFIHTIKPDVILWQFCYNDFISNEYDVEKKFALIMLHNNKPYLIGNKIVYKSPAYSSFLRKKSKVMDFIFSFYQEKKIKSINNTQFSQEVKEGLSKNDLNLEIKTTINILKRARNISEGIPFYFFSVDPFSYKERLICENVNITCIEEIGNSLDDIQTKRNIRTLSQGHWNVEGNRIMGRLLVDYFKKNNLLNNKK